MHGRYLKLLGLTMLAAVSVMAVSASAAQAKYLLLLNGASVNLLNLDLEGLAGYMLAENGLKIACSGGNGLAHVQVLNGGLSVSGTANATFEGCKWVGAEKTCTINDEGAGLVHAGGSGELVMPDASTYIVTAESAEFATIYTEGVFCTIPEEEVVSGKGHLLVLDALKDEKVKLGHLLALDLKLGNSKVKELVGEVHISDEDNPNATIAVHLVNL